MPDVEGVESMLARQESRVSADEEGQVESPTTSADTQGASSPTLKDVRQPNPDAGSASEDTGSLNEVGRVREIED